jgi:hypothetical protein
VLRHEHRQGEADQTPIKLENPEKKICDGNLTFWHEELQSMNETSRRGAGNMYGAADSVSSFSYDLPMFTLRVRMFEKRSGSNRAWRFRLNDRTICGKLSHNRSV